MSYIIMDNCGVAVEEFFPTREAAQAYLREAAQAYLREAALACRANEIVEAAARQQAEADGIITQAFRRAMIGKTIAAVEFSKWDYLILRFTDGTAMMVEEQSQSGEMVVTEVLK